MIETITGNWPELHIAQLTEQARGIPFLHELRNSAFERFVRTGFPDRHHERWRSTDISVLAGHPWKAAMEAKMATGHKIEIPHFVASSFRIVFVNGRFSEQLSHLPDNESAVVVLPFSHLQAERRDQVLQRMAATLDGSDHPFLLLNTALVEEGVAIWIPADTILADPVEIVHYMDSSEEIVTHPRHVIFAGERSESVVIESYYGRGRYFTNPVSDVVAGDDSQLFHYQIQRESEASYHVSFTRSSQGRDSRYRRYALDFGGMLVRHDVSAELTGEGGEASLYGLYMPQHQQHIDHHTTLRHLQPHTYSRQLYKGVLMDKAHAVFNGRIFVAREAQKTDAIQHNKNLLLSDQAMADTQPQLEIFADDVRCTHGGTIGQLNQDALFYLRARGIGKDAARHVLVHAFAGEIVAQIKTESVRELLEGWVLDRLGWEG